MVNCTLLMPWKDDTHQEHGARAGLGCSPSFPRALCQPRELHGNECLISVSLLALELVPPTLPGPCVCSLGARAGAGSGRQKYNRKVGPDLDTGLGERCTFSKHTILVWLNFHLFQMLHTILGRHLQTRHPFISVLHTWQEYKWQTLWPSVSKYPEHPPWYTVTVHSRAQHFPFFLPRASPIVSPLSPRHPFNSIIWNLIMFHNKQER